MNPGAQRREFADPDLVADAASPRVHRRLEVARRPERAEAPDSPDRASKRWLSPARLGFLATALLLYWGYHFPTELYITPQSGIGYVLGIIGGSSMLVLLVYPARKRFRVLRFLGTTKRWFQAHMVLGIVGPVLVLFHSNFSLGAANSNVALACMLVVSGSGIFGRYFYGRIHHGLHGRRANLAELKEYAERLRWVTTNVEFLPELVSRIEAEEQSLMARCQRLPLLLRPPASALGVALARRRLRRHMRAALRAPGASSEARARKRNLLETATTYINDRLAATRRVVEFSAYERLFSLWHALHLPLFMMLLVAAIVHVVAVHVY
ncbi:MAG: hypothetical protein U1F09_01670 [Steroidobacteraceae bacterium]